jgi:hypothetical protein
MGSQIQKANFFKMILIKHWQIIGTISTYKAVGQLKNTILMGIEPTTFQHVA